MSKTLRIFLIVLGLGIFILPKQMLSAQKKIECCEQKSAKENCCKKEKPTSCHSEDSQNSSEKKGCGDDCTQFHSCSVHSVMNYLSPDTKTFLHHHFLSQKLAFEYKSSYFSSNFNKIWQPPKIG